jgi:flagellar hook-associated protein FlgK
MLKLKVMVSAINNALTGLNAATQKVTQAANNIANLTTPGYTTETGDSVELSQEAVNLLLGKAAFKANVAVLETAKELDDTLLDAVDRKD